MLEVVREIVETLLRERVCPICSRQLLFGTMDQGCKLCRGVYLVNSALYVNTVEGIAGENPPRERAGGEEEVSTPRPEEDVQTIPSIPCPDQNNS